MLLTLLLLGSVVDRSGQSGRLLRWCSLLLILVLSRGPNRILITHLTQAGSMVRLGRRLVLKSLQAHTTCFLCRTHVSMRPLKELRWGRLQYNTVDVVVRVVRAFLATFSSLLANPSHGLSKAWLRHYSTVTTCVLFADHGSDPNTLFASIRHVARCGSCDR